MSYELPAGMPGGSRLPDDYVAPQEDQSRQAPPSLGVTEGVRIKLPPELAPLEPLFSDLIERYLEGERGEISVVLPALQPEEEPEEEVYPGDPRSDYSYIWAALNELRDGIMEFDMAQEHMYILLARVDQAKQLCLPAHLRK